MQFAIYTNADKGTNRIYPFFVDVQHNLLDSLNSRLVIPLTAIKNADKQFPRNLCPIIQIQSKEYALLTHQITSVPLGILKKKIGSAKENRDEILAAIDFIVTGI